MSLLRLSMSPWHTVLQDTADSMPVAALPAVHQPATLQSVQLHDTQPMQTEVCDPGFDPGKAQWTLFKTPGPRHEMKHRGSQMTGTLMTARA